MGKWLVVVALVWAAELPVRAQTVPDYPVALDAGAVIGLADQPFATAPQFAESLRAAIPDTAPAVHALSAPVFDPFLWSIGGTFADPPGAEVGGGLIACARYGVATRDWLAERRATEPTAYALRRQVLPWFDDAEVWPTAAVARLACSFVWDDTRSIEILPREAAHAAVWPAFQEVLVVPAEGLGPSYGPEGYRLEARGGRQNTVIHVESATIILTAGYQEIRFRVFLLSGGV